MEKTKKNTIEIDKDKFQNIMERMERLEKVADKARLQSFDDKNKKPEGKVVNLRMIEGKVITGWKMIKDIVEKNQHGAWDEQQEIEVIFEDNTKQKMPYVVFSRRYKALPAEVISETKEGDDISFNVKTAEGRKYKIGSKFVN